MTSIEILAHQLPATCPERNYLIALNLSFFLCKMGGITMSSGSEDFTHMKCLANCLAQNKCLDSNGRCY